MQAGALARQDVRIDGLAQQRVAERVGVAAAAHQHVVHSASAVRPPARAPAAPQSRRAGGAARSLRRTRRRAAPPGRVRQPLDARHHRVSQRLGQLVPPAASSSSARNALPSERASNRAPARARALRRGSRSGAGRARLRRTRQLDPLDNAGVGGEERAQGMTTVQLVAAIGRDSTMGSCRRLRIRYASRSRVERSARGGPRSRPRPARPRRGGRASPAPARAGWPVVRSGRVKDRARGPSTAASASGESSGSSWRRIAASGACGSSVAELDAVADQHARAAGARTLRELRQQARLATPASPLTRTVDAAPAPAAASAASSASSSSARPMKTDSRSADHRWIIAVARRHSPNVRRTRWTAGMRAGGRRVCGG